MSMWKEWFDGVTGKERETKLWEVGRGDNGEMSVDALKKWFVWSAAALGVCLIAVCVLAVVSSVRSRKEAAILEVDSGAVLELYLNRKGVILNSKGDAADVLEDHSLEDGVEKILQGLLDYGHLGDGGAVIFTLRPYENGVDADLERFGDEIHVYAEAFLRKKHSNGTIYVNVMEENASINELAQNYGVSVGKAALVKDLVDENTFLRNADIERLLKLSVDEISSEISGRKYDTSVITVVAKQVYAKQEETVAAVSEAEKTEAAAEESASQTAEAAAASGSAAETEAETEATEPESSAQDSAEEDGGAESEGEEVTDAAQDGAVSGDGQQTEATETQAEAETTVAAAEAQTQAETTAVATEAQTEAETTAAATEAQTQAETTAVATEAQTEAPTTAAQMQVETTAAPTTPAVQPETSPAPSMGSIIEQVIPITPETSGN